MNGSSRLCRSSGLFGNSSSRKEKAIAPLCNWIRLLITCEYDFTFTQSYIKDHHWHIFLQSRAIYCCTRKATHFDACIAPSGSL